MISVYTTAAWTTATISLDDGLGGGPQIFTPTSATTDGYTTAGEFADWVDSTFGDASSWVWARDTASGGATLTFTLPVGYTIVSSAAAQSILGADASLGPAATSMDWTAPSGTIAPSTPDASAYVDQDIKKLSTMGIAAANGVARVGIGGLVARSPRVRWPAYAVDFERLRATQAAASSPRRANIYDTADGWILEASLGPIAITRSGHTLWRVVAEVRA